MQDCNVVDLVHNVAGGLELAATGLHDATALDVKLPKIDGYLSLGLSGSVEFISRCSC